MFTEYRIKRPVRAVVCVILAVLLLSPLSVGAAEADQGPVVLVGGMTFGVRLETEGVLVVGVSAINERSGPAKEAGIMPRDIITAIDGVPVNHVEEVTAAVEGSGGRTLTVSLRREQDEGEKADLLTVPLTPVFSDEEGKYRTGLLIRSAAAGIGTVTFIDPATLTFCGLGHGICDVDTGMLLPLRKGEVYPVTLTGVKAGRRGEPGELQGTLEANRTGALLGNTVRGVWGVLHTLPRPDYAFDTADFSATLPLANKDEVHEGDAYILCTVQDGKIGRYSVRLSRIDPDADRKNFVVTVTDPALLDATGGIVQGMSGSPVIQDGKLVGAVTHVLVGEPTRGYGICIENMPRGE